MRERALEIELLAKLDAVAAAAVGHNINTQGTASSGNSGRRSVEPE